MRTPFALLALLLTVTPAPAGEPPARTPLFQRTAESVMLSFNRYFATDPDDGSVDMVAARDFRYTCYFIFDETNPPPPQRFCESNTADAGAQVAVREKAGALRAVSLVFDPVLLGERQQQAYLYNMLLLYLLDQVPPADLRQTTRDAANHVLRTLASTGTYTGTFSGAVLSGYTTNGRIHLDLNRT